MIRIRAERPITQLLSVRKPRRTKNASARPEHVTLRRADKTLIHNRLDEHTLAVLCTGEVLLRRNRQSKNQANKGPRMVPLLNPDQQIARMQCQWRVCAASGPL